MDNYDETFETWNKVANLYEQKFMFLDLYDSTYDYICDSVKPVNARILDIGCGPGNITKYLLSKKPDWDIIGIDIAPNMVRLAQKNNPTARFEVMDIRNIGSLDSRFDGIIAGFCLPYLSEIETNDLIGNAGKLLNPKGIIYLSFVEGEPSESAFKSGSAGRVFFQYHRLDDVIKNLHQFSFENVNIFKVNFKTSENKYDIHTIVTAIKK